MLFAALIAALFFVGVCVLLRVGCRCFCCVSLCAFCLLLFVVLVVRYAVLFVCLCCFVAVCVFGLLSCVSVCVSTRNCVVCVVCLCCCMACVLFVLFVYVCCLFDSEFCC